MMSAKSLFAVSLVLTVRPTAAMQARRRAMRCRCAGSRRGHVAPTSAATPCRWDVGPGVNEGSLLTFCSCFVSKPDKRTVNVRPMTFRVPGLERGNEVMGCSHMSAGLHSGSL